MEERLSGLRTGFWQPRSTATDLYGEAATVYTAMGVSPRTAFEVEKRPFFATEDGKGRPVKFQAQIRGWRARVGSRST
jgi:hypothetical protein